MRTEKDSLGTMELEDDTLSACRRRGRWRILSLGTSPPAGGL
jgi:hypothetical protein